MAEPTDIEIYADKSKRWMVEGIYPYIGAPVNASITKLEAETFTREEASFWIMCLAILQLHRMAFPMGPIVYTEYIGKPPEVYFPGER